MHMSSAGAGQAAVLAMGSVGKSPSRGQGYNYVGLSAIAQPIVAKMTLEGQG